VEVVEARDALDGKIVERAERHLGGDPPDPPRHRCHDDPAEHGRRLAGEDAAVAVCEGDLAARHLTFAACAAQLADRLDDRVQAVHAGMGVGEPAAVRVQRQRTARGDRTARGERPAIALGAEAEVLEEQDRCDRERVIELRDVNVGGVQARLRERGRAGAGGGRANAWFGRSGPEGVGPSAVG